MNPDSTLPNPAEPEQMRDSSAQPNAPEIRRDPPIHVPAHLIPPEEPASPEYDLRFSALDPQIAARGAQQIVPQDFRVPWQWSDVILFAIFYFGITIVVGLFLLGIGSSITHRGLQELANDKPISAVVGIIAQAIGSALSLLYLWVLIRKRRGGPFWQAIGWRSLNQNSVDKVRAWPFVVVGLGLAVLALLADQFFPTKDNLPMEEMFQTRGAIILLSVFGVLVAPFIEETIFRGFLYPVVGRSYGAAAAVVITGMIFGAYHAPQLWGGWAQIALIMIVGIVLTWARARQKSVLASFLIHISYNSMIFLVLAISTGGFKHLQP